ncbi:hypothetical protein [Vibrio sp. 10N.261.55.A7]|uniref:hypothetical protein n=1 Tax=Vibrio sp. 10N.261.55.A7 TaxID=1880851 RepID=UPI001056A171|nr:hypothetical protein [Vibrio sp. 10N.261.55.A7]
MKKSIIAMALITLSVSTSPLAQPEYNADVPQNIITPNSVESTYLGGLNYIDGAPTQLGLINLGNPVTL